MAKQLVTIDNLDEFICRGDGKFYMDGSRILTPGAKDELAARRVEIIHGEGCGHAGKSCREHAGACSCTQHGPCGDDEFLIAVAATLQKEYGVSDPAKLKSMSLEIVKTLKENLSIF